MLKVHPLKKYLINDSDNVVVDRINELENYKKAVLVLVEEDWVDLQNIPNMVFVNTVFCPWLLAIMVGLSKKNDITVYSSHFSTWCTLLNQIGG